MRPRRWNDSPTLLNGKPKPFLLVDRDMSILKLFGPRAPWPYRFLPTSYINTLLGRPRGNRIGRLRERPGRYLALAEQPRNNYRDYIYEIGPGGLAELAEDGIAFTKPSAIPRPAHTLLSNMIAASLEYGAETHGIDIRLHSRTTIQPDLPVFSLGDSYPIYLEADMATERLFKPKRQQQDQTSIEAKFEVYLNLIRERPAFVLFCTIAPARMQNLQECLLASIQTYGYATDFAEMFAFMVLPPITSESKPPRYFDRFLNAVPRLTDWAVTSNWTRAGNLPPLQIRGECHGAETRTHPRAHRPEGTSRC